MTRTDDLQFILDKSQNITFFLGREVSLLSGSKDYRAKDNAYKKRYRHSPDRIMTEEYFDLHPEIFYEFFYDRILSDKKTEKNPVYDFISDYQKTSKVQGVISQNIDDLITSTDIRDICQLYGSIEEFYCVSCRRRYCLSDLLKTKPAVPYCECYGYLRPDITLFDEMIREEKISQAVRYLENTDTLVVIGTDLKYLNESKLIDCFKGKNIIVISNHSSRHNETADLEIAAPIVRTLAEISCR